MENFEYYFLPRIESSRKHLTRQHITKSIDDKTRQKITFAMDYSVRIPS